MTKKQLTLLTTAELANIPRPKWLIEDFVAEKATTMIYGPWGLGKSFFALELALRASTGADVYGRATERPLKSLFIVAEGAAWWYRRLLAFEQEHGEIDRDMLLWIPQPVDLDHKDNAELLDLDAIIKEHDPDILFIDTWVRCSAAYGMNEDKATDTAQAYKNLDTLRDRYEVTPVIVHHPTKSGGVRGSGNQEASVERVIGLHEVENMPHTFDVKDEKGNHTEPFQSFRMTIQGVDLSSFAEGLTSAVLQYDGLSPNKEGKSNSKTLLAAVITIIPPQGWPQHEFENKGVPKGSIHKSLQDLVLQGMLVKDGSHYRLPIQGE